MIPNIKKDILLVFLLAICFFLFPAEDEIPTGGVNFSAGIRTSYASTAIVFSESEIESRLNTLTLSLEVDFDITHFLTVGVIAGYNWSRFSDALNIFELPLSLQIDQNANQSMIFGINLKSEFFSSGDISLSARGEFVYHKLFKQELDIILPVITGLATVKHWFIKANVDLLVKYHGFEAFVLFLGPQANIVGGTLTVSESIADISGEKELTHHQKGFLGLVGGVTYEFGLNWRAGLEVNLFSQTAIKAGIFYSF